MTLEITGKQKLSPIPLEFFEEPSADKIPCRFSYLKEDVQSSKVKTLIVDCSACQKSQCGLQEYACSYYISQESLHDPSFQSLIIGGKSIQTSYHSRQLERIRQLLKIYKKIKLEPIQEHTTDSCKMCYHYLSSMFRTLKVLVLSDPGMVYKHREFYRNYAQTLCPTCSSMLVDFIDLFESEIQAKDPQWCKDVMASSTFKVEFYSSIQERKRTETTTLTDTSHLKILKDRKINGYDVHIAQEPFSFGQDTDESLSEFLPITTEDNDFVRRQKVYVIDNVSSPELNKIISNLYDFITNDADIKRVLRFSLHSNEARTVVLSKIHQIFGSVLEDLEIDETALTEQDKIIIENKVLENTVGWGVWEIFLHDDHINEITAVAGSPVIIETYQDGKCKTNIIPSEEEYNRFIRLLTVNIRTADFHNRVLEAVIDPTKHEIHFGRMRLTLFTDPLVDKKTFIIRKHRKMQLSGSEILLFETMSPAQLAYCTAMKRRNKSTITYVGDVGSGKTTIQYIIDTKIPGDSSVITIGDIVELDIAEKGFSNITLYADRPGEEKIGQSRSSLITKALRMKSDTDQYTEVLDKEDTAAWLHTWVAGKAGTVTYHAASIDLMLVRCADELRITGTQDPATKMTVFQNVLSSRRILSTEGYKYRVVELAWILNEKDPESGLPIPLPLFKWDPETDRHILDREAFKKVYNSDKFRDVLYSVDTVKHQDFTHEVALYEKLWVTLLNCIRIYRDLDIIEHIAMGDIPHFDREIKIFVDVFDAQVNMYKNHGKTDWKLLEMLGKRQIYSDLLKSIDEICPSLRERALTGIQKYESQAPQPEFSHNFLLEQSKIEV